MSLVNFFKYLIFSDLVKDFVFNCTVKSSLIKGFNFFDKVYPCVKLKNDSYAVMYDAKPVVGLDVLDLVLDERDDVELLTSKVIKVVYDMPSAQSAYNSMINNRFDKNPLEGLLRQMEYPNGEKLRLNCDKMPNDFFFVRECWLSNFSRYL